tara:strand:- start:21 stop:8975 length:8955 start_codon:yes stop_codon:yes gene_type:complete
MGTLNIPNLGQFSVDDAVWAQLDEAGRNKTIEDIKASYAAPEPEESTSFLDATGFGLTQPLRNIGRSAEALGADTISDTLQSIPSPEGYQPATDRFMEPQEGDFSLGGFGLGYLPRAIVEQSGQLAGSLATSVGGRGVGAVVGSAFGPVGTAAGGAIGSVAGPAIFGALQVLGEIAFSRAEKNNREEPNAEDIVASLGTSVLVGAVDAFSAKVLLGAAPNLVGKLVKGGVTEGATEAIQSSVEQVGGSLGTEEGLTFDVKQAIGEGIIGAGIGAPASALVSGTEEISEPSTTESKDLLPDPGTALVPAGGRDLVPVGDVSTEESLQVSGYDYAQANIDTLADIPAVNINTTIDLEQDQNGNWRLQTNDGFTLGSFSPGNYNGDAERARLEANEAKKFFNDNLLGAIEKREGIITEEKARKSLQDAKIKETEATLNAAREASTPIDPFSVDEINEIGGTIGIASLGNSVASKRTAQAGINVQVGEDIRQDDKYTIDDIVSSVPDNQKQSARDALLRKRKPNLIENIKQLAINELASTKNIKTSGRAWDTFLRRTTGASKIDSMSEVQKGVLYDSINKLPVFESIQGSKPVDVPVLSSPDFTSSDINNIISNIRQTNETTPLKTKKQLTKIINSSMGRTITPVSKVHKDIESILKARGVLDESVSVKDGVNRSSYTVKPVEERYNPLRNIRANEARKQREESGVDSVGTPLDSEKVYRQKDFEGMPPLTGSFEDRLNQASLIPDPSERIKNRSSEFAREVMNQLALRGLGDIGLRFRSEAEIGGEGAYLSNKDNLRVIELALNLDSSLSDSQQFEQLLNVLNHESVHALIEMQNSGLGGPFVEGDVELINNIVSKAIKPNRADADFEGKTYLEIAKEDYSDLNEEAQVEEAFAEMMRDWSNGSEVFNTKGGGKVDAPVGIFRRILNFLLGIKQALKKIDIEKAEDLFTRVEKGRDPEINKTDYKLFEDAASPIKKALSPNGQKYVDMAKDQLKTIPLVFQDRLIVNDYPSTLDGELPNALPPGSETVYSLALKMDTAAKNSGGIIERTLENIPLLRDMISSEVLRGIAEDDSGATWYTDQMSGKDTYLYLIEPSIFQSRKNKDVFELALAVLSNQTAVQENLENALEAYRFYQKNNSLPEIATDFTNKSSIKGGTLQAFRLVNGVIDGKVEGFDLDSFIKFLDTPISVSDLNQWMLDNSIKDTYGISKVSQENVDQTLTGSIILGPKVGAFHQNIRGNRMALTQDRWFTRTMNRFLGQVSKSPLTAEQQAVRLKKIKDLFIENKDNPAQKWLLRSVNQNIKEANARAVKKGNPKPYDFEVNQKSITKIFSPLEKYTSYDSAAEIDVIGKMWSSQFYNAYRTYEAAKALGIELPPLENYYSKNMSVFSKEMKTLESEIKKSDNKDRFKDLFSDTQQIFSSDFKENVFDPEAFTKANTFFKNFNGVVFDTPKNGTYREYMRKVMSAVSDNIKEKTGLDLKPADIQAILWYPEKRHYVNKGVSSGRGDDNDFTDAAEVILNQERKGVTEDDIRKAEEDLKETLSRSVPVGGGGLSLPGEPEQRSRLGGEDVQVSRRSDEENTNQSNQLESIRREPGLSLFEAGKPKPSVLLLPNGIKYEGQIKRTYSIPEGSESSIKMSNSNISLSDMNELPSNEASSLFFKETIKFNQLGTGNPVDTGKDYSTTRMFVSSNGESAFSLNEDGEIDALFNSERANDPSNIYNTLLLATQLGGRKITINDSVSNPDMYSDVGFKPVARSEGKVLLVHDPEFFGSYTNNIENVVESDTLQDALIEQDTVAEQVIADAPASLIDENTITKKYSRSRPRGHKIPPDSEVTLRRSKVNAEGEPTGNTTDSFGNVRVDDDRYTVKIKKGDHWVNASTKEGAGFGLAHAGLHSSLLKNYGFDNLQDFVFQALNQQVTKAKGRPNTIVVKKGFNDRVEVTWSNPEFGNDKGKIILDLYEGKNNQNVASVVTAYIDNKAYRDSVKQKDAEDYLKANGINITDGNPNNPAIVKGVEAAYKRERPITENTLSLRRLSRKARSSYSNDENDIVNRVSNEESKDSAGEIYINQTTSKLNEIGPFKKMYLLFEKKIANKYAFIGWLDKNVKKVIVDSTTANSAMAAALLADRSKIFLNSAINRGVPVFNGVRVYTATKDKDGRNLRGLRSILSPIGRNGLWNQFQTYSAAIRAQNLMKEGKERLFENDKDIADALGLNETSKQQYPEIAEATYVTKDGETLTGFEAVHAELQEFNGYLVKYLVDTGVITESMKDEWLKNSDYIPFYRTDKLSGNFPVDQIMYPSLDSEGINNESNVTEGGLSAPSIDIDKTFPKLKGRGVQFTIFVGNNPVPRQSASDIAQTPQEIKRLVGVLKEQNPDSEVTVRITGKPIKGDYLENLLTNVETALTSGLKNNALLKSIDLMEQAGIAEDITESILSNDVGVDKTNAVTVRKDGVTKYYRVYDDIMLSSLNNIVAHQKGNVFTNMLAKPSNLLREMITRSPAFMAFALIRDSAMASATTGRSVIPIWDGFTGAIDAYRGTESSEALKNSLVYGGYDLRGSSGDVSRTLKEGFARDTAVGKTADIKRTMFRMWEWLGDVSNASDAAVRIKVYEKVLKETGNEDQAIYEAMEVINYARRGDSAVLQALIPMVTFLNARIQGLMLMRTAFAHDTAMPDAKKAQKNFLIRSGMMAGLTTILWMIQHDDEQWQEQRAQERDLHWILTPGMIGLSNDKPPLRIPIPFEWGFLFKVIPERILEAAFGDDDVKDVMQSMSRNIAGTFNFLPLPQAVKPITEVLGNYNIFTGEPIESSYVSGLKRTERYYSGTSELAKSLSNITPASPIQIDHLIRGYLGTVGLVAVDAADSLLNLYKGKPVMPPMEKGFEKSYFVGKFLSDSVPQGTIEKFYELKDSVDEITNTVAKVRRTEQRNYELSDSELEKIKYKKMVSKAARQLSDLRAMASVERSRGGDPERLRDISVRMANIARRVVDTVDNR